MLNEENAVKTMKLWCAFMEKRKFIASKYIFTDSQTRQFAPGMYYAILYIASGTCYFEIEDEVRFCGTEDVIIMKPGEKTMMRFRDAKHQLEILELRVLPEYLRELSNEETDLEQGFLFVPYKVTVVHAGSEESMLIKNIVRKVAGMKTDGDEERYGHRLYEDSLITMLLVLSLRACIRADHVHRTRQRRHILMDDIFQYIGEHLTEELSLEVLEQKFFVSRYHICREFKRLTGQTPHAYIVKARLDLCRKYIEQGKAINEVYQLGGFGGYSHFFRAFKQEYGVTPKEYYQNLQIRLKEEQEEHLKNGKK